MSTTKATFANSLGMLRSIDQSWLQFVCFHHQGDSPDTHECVRTLTPKRDNAEEEPNANPKRRGQRSGQQKHLVPRTWDRVISRREAQIEANSPHSTLIKRMFPNKGALSSRLGSECSTKISPISKILWVQWPVKGKQLYGPEAKCWETTPKKMSPQHRTLQQQGYHTAPHLAPSRPPDGYPAQNGSGGKAANP